MSTPLGRTAMKIADVKREMLDTARIAQTFLDGDLCRTMLRPYAEKFLSGDDLDLNPESCVPIKKTLMRLERLSRIPCSTAVWRRRPDMPDKCEILLFGVATAPGAESKPPVRGYQPPPMTPPLETALVRGKLAFASTRAARPLVKRWLVQPVSDRRGLRLLSLFAPIRDSMGTVAAALEIFTVVEGS